jgi:hypothetical protein
MLPENFYLAIGLTLFAGLSTGIGSVMGIFVQEIQP